MSDTDENRLRDSQLVSIGKMLAGFTHELKNHLAIINESNGLMGDLLEVNSIDNDQTVQRFRKIINTIGDRVAQANTMAKHLNSFAHRMDQPDSVFDVNELILEECAFLDRFSRLKSISLQTNLHSGLPSVHNNPSLLAFVFFAIIQKTIDRIDSGGKIVLSSQIKDQDVIIGIESQIAGSPPIERESCYQTDIALEYALKKMGITITEKVLREGQHQTIMVIPSA